MAEKERIIAAYGLAEWVSSIYICFHEKHLTISEKAT
jgi:hypothetical protein